MFLFFSLSFEKANDTFSSFCNQRKGEREKGKPPSVGNADATRIMYASVCYHHIETVNHFYIRCGGHCYLSKWNC